MNPRYPVRGLHLSRVKSAFRSPVAAIAVLPRNHADLRPHQAIPVLRRVTLHALYALQERPESASSRCSGTLGGPLAGEPLRLSVKPRWHTPVSLLGTETQSRPLKSRPSTTRMDIRPADRLGHCGTMTTPSVVHVVLVRWKPEVGLAALEDLTELASAFPDTSPEYSPFIVGRTPAPKDLRADSSGRSSSALRAVQPETTTYRIRRTNPSHS